MQGSLTFPAISELAKDDVVGVVVIGESEELGVAVLDGCLFELPVESKDCELGDY